LTAMPDLVSIFQEVPWGWAVSNATNHELLMMNPAFARLHGYTVAELQGQFLHELVVPESRPEFHRHVRRSSEAGYHTYESFHRRKDRRVFPVQVNMTAHKNGSGRVEFHSALVHDLTERQQDETSLRLREELWRAGVQNSNDAIITTDDADKIIFWNKRAQEIFGYLEEEVKDRSITRLISKRQVKCYRQEIDRLLALEDVGPPGENFEITGRRKDGRKFPLEMSLAIWKAQGQRFTTATIRDITQRKRAEAAFQKSQACLAKAQRLAHLGSFDWDISQDKISLSEEIFHIFGLTPEAFGGSYADFMSFIHPEDQDTVKLSVSRVLSKDLPFSLTYRVVRPDGTVRVVQNYGEIYCDEAGQPLRIIGTVQDITEKREADAERRKLSMAVEQASDWVMIIDKQNKIEYVNPAVEAITGYTKEELIGGNPAIFSSGTNESDFCKGLLQTVSTGNFSRYICTNRKKNHELFQLDLTVTPLRDDQGNITHYLTTAKDITQQLQLEERLNYLAYYDGLTGIPNRNLAKDRLKQALSRAEAVKQLIAVLFLDLDRFKFLNDTFGVEVGDDILKEIAGRLEGLLQEGETVARVGSDEFMLVLAHLNQPDDVVLELEKIKEAITQPIKSHGDEIVVTTSIGISIFPQDGENDISLLKHALTACVRAKNLGGNNYQFYNPGMNIMAEEFVSLGKKLFQAHKREEFILYYQPYFHIDTEQLVGLEALIRWRRPEYGLLPPDTFIPVLEETGIIREVGEWTMRESWRQIKAWLDSGYPVVPVSVNFSPVQFRCCELPAMVERIIEETGLDPSHIILEITETALMQDVDFTRTVLTQFKDLGFGIAIDDFGTGYSSLSYLRKFPIDYLKIDISFIKDLTTDPDAAAIVTAIISMAHSLGLKTIAEGVETKEQREILRLLRCDILQGFYYSRPIPAVDIEPILTRGGVFKDKELRLQRLLPHNIDTRRGTKLPLNK
jgi:diguanylate cyclase (GGDEF)-like protein/PAS domain S-box-containing protein